MRFSVWFVLGQGMRLTRNREAEAAGAGWNHLLKNLAWLGLVLGLQGSPHVLIALEQGSRTCSSLTGGIQKKKKKKKTHAQPVSFQHFPSAGD